MTYTHIDTAKDNSGYNAILTIVVFTMENPDSQQMKYPLLSNIKDGGYAYIPAKGKLGDTECHYAVFNMSADTAKILCSKYKRTSFVYSELGNDGSIHSEYYEKHGPAFGKHSNKFVQKEICDTREEIPDADDNFTITGEKFKYCIPFTKLKAVNQIICENLRRMVSIAKERWNQTITEEDVLRSTINKVGLTPYLWRKATTKGFDIKNYEH